MNNEKKNRELRFFSGLGLHTGQVDEHFPLPLEQHRPPTTPFTGLWLPVPHADSAAAAFLRAPNYGRRFSVPRGAVRAEYVGPAARSLRFALLEPPGLGALSSVRRANVRSRSEIRKFASEGTKKIGNNHQTTILGLVRPTAHGAPRAGFPPPLTLPCCGTYLQGGNGVGVQGDSTARYPAHCPLS